MKAPLTKLGRLFSKKKATATITNDDQCAAFSATGFGKYGDTAHLKGRFIWEDLPLRQKHIEIEKTNKATRSAGNTQAGHCPKIIRINVAGNLIVRY